MPAAEKKDEPAFISVVITVRNEERHLAALFESLLRQSRPFEVVLVDAYSDDRTWEIAQDFQRRHPDLIRVFQHRGHRGAGRNYGVEQARGPTVAFIDGDCTAGPQWLEQLRKGLGHAPIVAGTTAVEGPEAFSQLERVELLQHGVDVTYPSCNLAYPRQMFLGLGGFDERFITAEDIDLNLRAVRSGARIHFEPGALVHHFVRETVPRFLLQAFWNGYGRKQLTEKHGQLWANYQYRRMLSTQASPLAYARLLAALVGYFTRLVTVSGTDRRIPPDAGAGAGGSPSHSKQVAE
ncbi:MAG: glycosyltransferase [Euryarchaeota archaeon]|nr:glycosyltransferase [Euryarchaeota archaeon]MDE1837859.1 glycosyltransferase [Euryarchaeota archaeon]MDE1880143.1 glycosyltransferase [Euryarchaeota archaeon]MDE2046532.1 glycosyltransferase [Thermoplasmata archaeon]